MKIKITQLGNLKDANIELNDLTLFCGANNTGKTYAMYSIYGLLDFKFEVNLSFVREIIKHLNEKGIYQLDLNELIENHFDEVVRNIEKNFLERLPRLFSAESDRFKGTRITLDFDKLKSLENAKEKEQVQRIHLGKEELVFEISKLKDETKINLTLIDADKLPTGFIFEEISKFILKLIFANNFKNAFLLPAERSGLNLFFKELASRRTAFFHNFSNKKNNPDFFKDIEISRYPEPIADYIDWLNEKEIWKVKKGDYHILANVLQKTIVKGDYSLVSNEIYFTPHSSKDRISLHLSSSTVKNLFGLWFYLNHRAKKGDCLMIDEPELNLHPDNQRLIARLLAQLVNTGLKVIVSTHSDYFVRELNNLIMLKNDFKGANELKKQYGYQNDQLLNEQKISAYFFEDETVEKMKMDDEGIIVETFDVATNDLNESSNKIYFAMQDAKEMTD